MHCSCEFFSLMCLSQVHPFIYLQEMTNAGTSVCRFRNLSSESWHSWCADSATNASWLEWSTNKFFLLICMFCSFCAISNFLSFVRMVYLYFISKLRYWFWHIIFISFSYYFHLLFTVSAKPSMIPLFSPVISSQHAGVNELVKTTFFITASNEPLLDCFLISVVCASAKS